MGSSYTKPQIDPSDLEDAYGYFQNVCQTVLKQDKKKRQVAILGQEYIVELPSKTVKYVKQGSIWMSDGSHKKETYLFNSLTIEKLLSYKYNYHYFPSEFADMMNYQEENVITMAYLLLECGLLERLQKEFPQMDLAVEQLEKPNSKSGLILHDIVLMSHWIENSINIDLSIITT